MYSLIWPPKEPKPWPLRFSSDLSQKKLAFITMTPLYLVIGDGYTPPFFLHHLKPQIVVTDFDFEIPYQTLITMKDIGLRRYIYNGKPLVVLNLSSISQILALEANLQPRF
ncbi:hypothetical protein ES332_A03G119200v1 [Gossypium tomentosum]|uniref:Uncharacterized protein n=1 Tax=Gossypium tomentosum TaxID=34277 RepID=A0A5D2R999_GOSTO|nr:hypothetical protein ES332_A03G119200v1 [Gossypium tomentosum]